MNFSIIEGIGVGLYGVSILLAVTIFHVSNGIILLLFLSYLGGLMAGAK